MDCLDYYYMTAEQYAELTAEEYALLGIQCPAEIYFVEQAVVTGPGTVSFSITGPGTIIGALK